MGAAIPRGPLPVAAGLVVLGVGAYGYLVIAGHALGPARFASVSVLYVLVLTVGPGLLQPLEQEVARALASRRAVGLGGAPVVARAAAIGAAVVAVLLVLLLVGAGPLSRRLFEGNHALLLGLGISFVALYAAHLSRGVLAGSERFVPYGTQLAAEGSTRLVGAVVLAVSGTHAIGPFGVLMGIAPAAGVLVTAGSIRRSVVAGPPAPWRELSTAFGVLLGASLLSQALINAGPIAVKVLAAPTQQSTAGRLLAGLVIARVPLLLFVSMQVVLLPSLASLAGAGRRQEFRASFRRVLLLVAALASFGTVAAAVIGPWVVAVGFGPGFRVGHLTMAVLALASGCYMVAVVAGVSCVALAGYFPALLGWLVGVVTFVVVVALQHALVARVEIGFLAGTFAAALALLAAQRWLLSHGSPRRGSAPAPVSRAS